MPSFPHPSATIVADSATRRRASAPRRCLQLALLLVPLCVLLTMTSLYAQSDGGAPDSHPSGAPTGVPDYVPLIYAPLIVNAWPDEGPHVEGQLTLGDGPFSGALIEVRQCDGDLPGAEVVLTATTNLAGYFHANLPETPSLLGATEPISYALTLLSAPQITGTEALTETPFAIYTSRCLYADGGIKRLLPALDLAAPQVITPTQAITVDMPVTFHWQGRSNHLPDEEYHWIGSVKFDCGACAPVIINSPPLTATATSVEWCSIAPHSSGATDVAYVDYFLRVTNSHGTGESAVRRVNVDVTTHECPPLP